MIRLFTVLDWQGRKVKGSDRQTKREAKDVRDTLNVKVKKPEHMFTIGLSIDHFKEATHGKQFN